MPRSSAEKMREYRARKRAAGYRLVQRWLPDTRTPEFRAEARRQSLIAAQSEGEKEILDWIEKAQADLDLPPYED